MSDDFEEEVRKWVDAGTSNYGETWDFKTQKTIEGVFKGSHVAKTKWGEKIVYDIEAPDHKTMSVWEKAQIKRFFNETEVGTEVKITFLGRETTENGQPFNNFKFQRKV